MACSGAEADQSGAGQVSSLGGVENKLPGTAPRGDQVGGDVTGHGGQQAGSAAGSRPVTAELGQDGGQLFGGGIQPVPVGDEAARPRIVGQPPVAQRVPIMGGPAAWGAVGKAVSGEAAQHL